MELDLQLPVQLGLPPVQLDPTACATIPKPNYTAPGGLLYQGSRNTEKMRWGGGGGVGEREGGWREGGWGGGGGIRFHLHFRKGSILSMTFALKQLKILISISIKDYSISLSLPLPLLPPPPPPPRIFVSVSVLIPDAHMQN